MVKSPHNDQARENRRAAAEVAVGMDKEGDDSRPALLEGEQNTVAILVPLLHLQEGILAGFGEEIPANLAPHAPLSVPWGGGDTAHGMVVVVAEPQKI